MRGSGKELIRRNENEYMGKTRPRRKVPDMKVREMELSTKAREKVHGTRAEEKVGKRHHITRLSIHQGSILSHMI